MNTSQKSRRSSSTVSQAGHVATFLIEIALAVWTLWRYRMSRLVQLSVAQFPVPRGIPTGRIYYLRRIIWVIAIDVGKNWLCSHRCVTSTWDTLTKRSAKQKVPWLLAVSYGSMLFMGYFLFCNQRDFGHYLRRQLCLFFQNE